jgi:molybdopterin-guanine dinucleotide biosynthesis protein A
VDSSSRSNRADEPAAIILAGGAARRLGAARPAGGKAACEVGGEPLLGRVTAAVAPVIAELVVVGGSPLPAELRDRFRGLRQLADSQPGAGPLAAVRDGLLDIGHRRATAGQPLPAAVLLAACDLPLLRPPLVQALLDWLPPAADGAAWVIPQVGSQPQYLLSVCRPQLLGPLEAFLATGRRDLRGFAAAVTAQNPGRVNMIPPAVWQQIDPDGAAGRDIDTPADLAALTGLASRRR